MKNILISDVKYRMTVPAIRDLSMRGYPITALEYNNTPPSHMLGFFSKYTYDKKILPFEEKDFIEALSALAKSDKEKPILLPFGRRTLGILSRHPELSDDMLFIVPSPDALKDADNKQHVMKIAKSIGVPVPYTATVEDFPSLASMAEQIPFPCVIKYQNGEALGLKPAQRYHIVKSKEVFQQIYTEMAANQSAPLAQEYIAGAGFGASLLLDQRGALIDFICHERIREYPASGGPSSCCKAIFDRPLLKYAYALLRAINFTGVAMVEFRGSLKSPYLMEINPRFWGTSPLIAASGSPFYENVILAAQDHAVPIDIETCLPAYQVGQSMRFMPQDLLCFPAYLKKSRKKLNFILKYLNDAFLISAKDGLFSWNDMKPYFRYLYNSFKEGQ